MDGSLANLDAWIEKFDYVLETYGAWVSARGKNVHLPPWKLGVRTKRPGVPGLPFHVWPPSCCIHPILYLENEIPLIIFGPPCCEILATGLILIPLHPWLCLWSAVGNQRFKWPTSQNSEKT